MKIRLPLIILSLLIPVGLSAQFTDSVTGLLQMPSAEMQQSGVVSITNTVLNQHATASPKWEYTTFSYGFSIAFWSRLEVAYICTIIDGKKNKKPTKRDMILFNQDRHFAARVQLLKEGEFWQYMPSIVVGISDPVSQKGEGYIGSDVSKNNGYFNRTYIVSSKHFDTAYGMVSGHLGYIYNKRQDYRLNGVCAGVCWSPVWLSDHGLLKEVKLIAEYDTRTVNVGSVVSLWDDRFECMVEWQGFKWMNCGIRYKFRLQSN